jgi:hypothetical protein
MTLPEMVFGDTWLHIKNEAQGVDFSFKAYEALDACPREVDVQVTRSQQGWSQRDFTWSLWVCFSAPRLTEASERVRVLAIANR